MLPNHNFVRINTFIFSQIVQNDHLTWGDMFEHTLGWWNLAKERENNIVFVYEEMKKDLRVSTNNYLSRASVTFNVTLFITMLFDSNLLT